MLTVCAGRNPDAILALGGYLIMYGQSMLQEIEKLSIPFYTRRSKGMTPTPWTHRATGSSVARATRAGPAAAAAPRQGRATARRRQRLSLPAAAVLRGDTGRRARSGSCGTDGARDGAATSGRRRRPAKDNCRRGLTSQRGCGRRGRGSRNRGSRRRQDSAIMMY